VDAGPVTSTLVDMSMTAHEIAALRVARALGDPTRFRLLREIAERGEVSCRDLTARLRIAQATVSHHLRVLSEAGLVTARAEGAYHWYSVRRAALAEHGRSIATTFGSSARSVRAAGRAR